MERDKGQLPSAPVKPAQQLPYLAAINPAGQKTLMEKLSGLNQKEHATILMVTHDSNAASYCKRILFIQDGVIFHELRRDLPTETWQEFYTRILKVMAQLGGGSANVL